MFDPKLVKLLVIVMISGTAGSLLALIPVIFKKNDDRTSFGTTAGIGFLAGVSLGGLFGVFAVLLDKI